MKIIVNCFVFLLPILPPLQILLPFLLQKCTLFSLSCLNCLGKQIEFPVIEADDNLMLGLLVVGKACATEISKMLFHAPGVNFALVSSVRYATHHLHTVSIRVVATRLQELWTWILSKSSSLLSKGLVGIVMQSGNFVWLRGKPSASK